MEIGRPSQTQLTVVAMRMSTNDGIFVEEASFVERVTFCAAVAESWIKHKSKEN